MAENMRRKFTAAEKSRAVRKLMKGETPGEVADNLGATVSQVVRWQSRFLEAGDMAMTQSSRRRTDWGKVVQWTGIVAVLVMLGFALTRMR